MASKSEVGHAKNVANFVTLYVICEGYALLYNPSKNSIKLVTFDAKKTASAAKQSAVNALYPAYDEAQDARKILFAPLSSLTTDILNGVKASEVTKGFIADVKTLANKIRGIRSTPKPVDIPDTDQDESKNFHSTSQMSFDLRLDNFDKLIALLGSNSGYAPNETPIKVITLKALYTAMLAANKAVIDAFNPLDNARIARDVELYHEETGLVTVAADVKFYIKSAFGSTSAQFKQVSKLKFVRPKKD